MKTSLMAVQFWPKNNTTTTPTRERENHRETNMCYSSSYSTYVYVYCCMLIRALIFPEFMIHEICNVHICNVDFFWLIKPQILSKFFFWKNQKEKKNYVCAVICYIHPLWTWDCNLCLLHSFNILEILKVGTTMLEIEEYLVCKIAISGGNS